MKTEGLELGGLVEWLERGSPKAHARHQALCN